MAERARPRRIVRRNMMISRTSDDEHALQLGRQRGVMRRPTARPRDHPRRWLVGALVENAMSNQTVPSDLSSTDYRSCADRPPDVRAIPSLCLSNTGGPCRMVRHLGLVLRRGGRTDLTLVAVTGLFAMMIGIPTLLALARRAHPPGPAGTREETTGKFDQWADREVDLQTGPVKGKYAAIETALPIAAVAFGMTAFALVLHFSV